jgi:HSP20 family molecular chaperone IbpA
MKGGGIIGVFLALLAGGILVYWMKEVMNQFKVNEKSSSAEKWDLDVIEDNRDITIVTKIPSPCAKVAIFLKGRVLHVTDESNLKLDIPLKKDVKILSSTYKNKVLQIKLEKIVKKSES